MLSMEVFEPFTSYNVFLCSSDGATSTSCLLGCVNPTDGLQVSLLEQGEYIGSQNDQNTSSLAHVP
jgi:hypothetical protein